MNPLNKTISLQKLISGTHTHTCRLWYSICPLIDLLCNWHWTHLLKWRSLGWLWNDKSLGLDWNGRTRHKWVTVRFLLRGLHRNANLYFLLCQVELTVPFASDYSEKGELWKGVNLMTTQNNVMFAGINQM